MTPECLTGSELLPADDTEPVSCNPTIVHWSGIHWDELAPIQLIDEHIARSQAPHVVHIPDGHPASEQTKTRGAILPQTNLPVPQDAGSVTTVYVRQHEDGRYLVSRRPPTRHAARWQERRMLDLNRMSHSLPASPSLSAYVEELMRKDTPDPRLGILSKMLSYPDGLIVSWHEDNDRRPRNVGSRISEGAYLYVTGSDPMVQRVLPGIRAGMNQLRKHGFALRNGPDDPILNKIARGGVIVDIVRDDTVPDGSLEHFFALLTHRRYTVDGRHPLNHPLVLTVELPGLATIDQKRKIFDLISRHVVDPVWQMVFPQTENVQ